MASRGSSLPARVPASLCLGGPRAPEPQANFRQRARCSCGRTVGVDVELQGSSEPDGPGQGDRRGGRGSRRTCGGDPDRAQCRDGAPRGRDDDHDRGGRAQASARTAAPAAVAPRSAHARRLAIRARRPSRRQWSPHPRQSRRPRRSPPHRSLARGARRRLEQVSQGAGRAPAEAARGVAAAGPGRVSPPRGASR